MKILLHGDECSGLTILDDGTRFYWTEGYSDTTVVYPDGRREVVGPWDVEAHPLAAAMTDMDGDQRPMTEAEEVEFDLVRETVYSAGEDTGS